MQEKFRVRQKQARGRAIVARLPAENTPWWLWAIFSIGLLCTMPVHAQSTVVPERQAPTLPPGAGGDQGLSTPRSETPTAPLDGTRPVPDQGVMTPPVGGSTPVIRPPSVGTMPVIPPPGSPGGDKSVVPK